MKQVRERVQPNAMPRYTKRKLSWVRGMSLSVVEESIILDRLLRLEGMLGVLEP